MAAEAAAAREFRLTGQQREPSLCESSDDCVMRLKRRPTAVFASPRRQGRLDDHRERRFSTERAQHRRC
jgi:hypothetical protein